MDQAIWKWNAIVDCQVKEKPTEFRANLSTNMWFKGIVHFEMNFWYVLAYLKGIQDVGVFVSAIFDEGLWSPPQRAWTEKSKLNMI